jgi:hypothetical protein
VEAEATPLPEARRWVVQRIEELRAENRIAELVDLLHERSALYEGRSEDETARIRGWLLLSLGSGELPASALDYVLEEIESGRNPFAVAAAARALKAARRLPEATEALIESAIRRMRYLDQPLDLDELSPKASGTTTATRELQAAAAEIRARPACCRQPPSASEALPATPIALGDVEAEDQDGARLPLSRLFEGRVTALTFFYTRCGNPQKCSLTISKLARLRDLVEAGGLGDRIAVAAITYDPDFDLPPRLQTSRDCLTAASMKLANRGCGSKGLRLQLRVELHPHEPRMVGPLDDLGQGAVGAHAGEEQAAFLERRLVVDVDLVAVAVAFADPVGAVDRVDDAVAGEHRFIGAEAHRAAHVAIGLAALLQPFSGSSIR